MSYKLLWTGLTIILSATVTHIPVADIVGAVIMLIGIVLLWLDK